MVEDVEGGEVDVEGVAAFLFCCFVVLVEGAEGEGRGEQKKKEEEKKNGDTRWRREQAREEERTKKSGDSFFFCPSFLLVIAPSSDPSDPLCPRGATAATR